MICNLQHLVLFLWRKIPGRRFTKELTTKTEICFAFHYRICKIQGVSENKHPFLFIFIFVVHSGRIKNLHTWMWFQNIFIHLRNKYYFWNIHEGIHELRSFTPAHFILWMSLLFSKLDIFPIFCLILCK